MESIRGAEHFYKAKKLIKTKFGLELAELLHQEILPRANTAPAYIIHCLSKVRYEDGNILFSADIYLPIKAFQKTKYLKKARELEEKQQRQNIYNYFKQL